jgi:hypothetical protein
LPFGGLGEKFRYSEIMPKRAPVSAIGAIQQTARSSERQERGGPRACGYERSTRRRAKSLARDVAEFWTLTKTDEWQNEPNVRRETGKE